MGLGICCLINESDDAGSVRKERHSRIPRSFALYRVCADLVISKSPILLRPDPKEAKEKDIVLGILRISRICGIGLPDVMM
jgi:hypothetical protein